MDRSVRLGRYWRSRPFVFSFVLRCHGLPGWAKNTRRAAAGRSGGGAISGPWSQVRADLRAHEEWFISRWRLRTVGWDLL
jgi:hypothetical protein